jgi:hypothetical protein
LTSCPKTCKISTWTYIVAFAGSETGCPFLKRLLPKLAYDESRLSPEPR